MIEIIKADQGPASREVSRIEESGILEDNYLTRSINDRIDRMTTHKTPRVYYSVALYTLFLFFFASCFFLLRVTQLTQLTFGFAYTCYNFDRGIVHIR